MGRVVGAAGALRTTREVKVYDAVGNRVERRKEVFLAEGWRVIDRTRYVHNAAGKVIRETDFAGRETVSVWGDGCCGKVSETLPDGTVYTYAYDGTGRLIRKTRRAGGLDTVAYERDALGRVVAAIDGRGNRRTYAYDARGLLASRASSSSFRTARGTSTRSLFGIPPSPSPRARFASANTASDLPSFSTMATRT